VVFYIILANLMAMVAEAGVSIANVYFHRSRNVSSYVIYTNGLLWSEAYTVSGLLAVRTFSKLTSVLQRELLLLTGEDVSFVINFLKDRMLSSRR
jgi:hypothetical protein